MYNSPIEIIYGQMKTQIEGDILKAVQECDIHVDKEELIRALQYDREQYDRGFADGYQKAKDEVVRCRDCKYAMDMMPIENSGGCLMGECTLRKEDDIVFTAWGDEFCSYGERKDNG